MICIIWSREEKLIVFLADSRELVAILVVRHRWVTYLHLTLFYSSWVPTSFVGFPVELHRGPTVPS